MEPYQPEPSEETPDGAGEIDELSEKEETTEKITVNPEDVPLEIVEPKGDGVQMDLFDELNDGGNKNV